MLVAIDTETFLITEETLTPELVVVSHCSPGKEPELVLAADSGLFDLVHGWLTKDTCVFANAPFDLAVFRAKWPSLDSVILQAYEEGRIKDVLTREKLIDISTGKFFETRGKHGLAAVAMRRLAMKLDKSSGVRTSYEDLHGIPMVEWPHEAIEYAKRDALATLEVYLSQEAQRKKKARDPLADEAHQARGHWALYQQTLVGIATDVDKVKALDEVLLREIAEHEAEAVKAGFLREVRSKKETKLVLDTKAVKAAFEEYCAESGTEPLLTNKGAIATSKAAFEEADLPKDHPLQHCRLMKAKKTLRSKGIAPMLTGIVRTNYSELQETGRTSSSGSKLYPSTNLQNMPRAEGFRECLIARPGKTFVISDWVAAELVSLSQVLLNLFDHSKLADALREGRDPHIEMGCLIGNVKLADFDKSNPEHKELRQLAKAANFGLPGGLGAESFIAFAKATYGVELTLQQAYDVKEAWFEQWPEMREYFKWINDQGDENNEFEILHHWSKRVRGKCRYTQACNTLFQGLASDCAKVALWNLLKTGRDPMSPLFGAQQVLFVHDEIVTECDIEDAPDALAEQEKIMIKSFAVPCPDVPVRVESKISSYYRKT